MLAGTTVRWKVDVGAETGMGAHCGFRRYIHFRRGLTLQIKFVYSLNSLKCQLPSQSFLAKLCVS